MKWQTTRKSLLNALMGAEMVVQEKMGFSISSTVQINATPEGVSITANNGEMAFQNTAEGEVINTGSICVSYARFMGIVKEMPEGKIELFIDSTQLTLHISPLDEKRNLEIHIKGITAENFPAMPMPEESSIYIGVECSFFRKMINSVAFAVASQASKYALNGIYLECKNKKLAMVASDGRRMAVAKTFLSDEAEDFSVIMPHSFMVGLSTKVLEGDGLLGINYSAEEGRVYFTSGSSLLNTSVVGGEYPAYEEFLRSSSEKHFFANTASLAKAVRVCAVMFDSDTAPQVILNITENNLVLTTEEKKTGTSKESLAIQYEGSGVKISFNAKLLGEILRVFEGDTVEVGMEDEESPAIIKQKGSSDLLYVLMPMRLAETSGETTADAVAN